MSVLRSLAVYFSLGALLFVAVRVFERERPEPVKVVVSADASEGEIANAKREAVLVREARRIGALSNDPALVQWIVEALPEDRRTRDDVLAMLEMGIEERDPVIRRRLIYWAERILESEADVDVTAKQLEAHLEAYAERFVRPVRTRLELVFFSRARHGEEALGRAREAELPADRAIVGEAYREGDPHMHLRPLLVLGDEEITRRFGPEVAVTVREIEPGRWSEPVESRAGVFRVRVLERTAPATPPLDEIEQAVRADLIRDRRAKALRDGIARLMRDAEFEVVRR